MSKSLNKVMLIGRLTRDPEVRVFTNGGKVCKFGFAVSNRKKNQQTGQWEDEPVFVDCEVFNRGENGRQADLAEQSLRLIEGVDRQGPALGRPLQAGGKREAIAEMAGIEMVLAA